MIRNLQLKNFRQHTDLALSFDQGVTVLRGANEAGKSTVFEAIAYALFGARATRNNELTTWGQPEGSHQVVLTFEINGVEYTIKRNAKSAELNYDGGRVTGQTDTARFCEQLLDLKSGMGTKLMLVPQNEMRGTLSDGGAKTTAMIEQLADLGQIEEIITKLQTHWHTGKTDLIEHSLETFKQQHAEAKEELAATENPEQALQDKLKGLKQQQLEFGVLDVGLMIICGGLENELSEAEEVEKLSQEIERRTLVAQTKLEAVQRTLSDPVPEFDERAVAQTEEWLEHARREQALYQDWLSMKDYQPVARSTRSEEQLCADLERLEEERQAVERQLATNQASRKLLSSQISHDLTCPTCKREWDDADARRAANKEKMDAIDNLYIEEQELCDTINRIVSERNSVDGLLNQPLKYPKMHSLWEVVDDGMWPPLFQWSENIPTEVTDADIRATEKEVAEARLQQQLHIELLNKRQAAQDQQVAVQGLLTQLEEVRQTLPVLERSSQDVRLELHDKQREWQDAKRKLAELNSAIENFDKQHQPVRDAYRALQKRVEQTAAEVSRYTEELKAARQANALLKALRTVKPQLANQVWQTVCSTVSHYFSLMRNQPSVVSKEAAGFAVDGHDTESLSGSTLDILGLAIRIALTKTFMPTCRFLLLDEPFAASDAERTAQALGFISSVGFDQVVIITHEDATEAVADNLITI